MPHDPQLQEERHALQARLPHLAQRVFALRGTGYRSGKFHWILVRSIGELLHGVNDFDSPYDWDLMAAHQDAYEVVLESVRLAELELELKQIQIKGHTALDYCYPDASDLALLALTREYGYDPLRSPKAYTEVRQVLRALAQRIFDHPNED